MKLFSILTAVLVAVGALSLTETTSAKGGGGHSGGGHSSGGQSAHGSKGTQGGKGTGGKNMQSQGHPGANGHAHGHDGRGGHHGGGKSRNWRNWSRYCWFPAYNCYGYFCSCDNTWYYWHGPSDSYLPCSDMPSYPPDNSAPPMMPPGATEIR